MTASDRAVHVLRCLLEGGVREVVLAPGSRSAPLALALHAADAAGDVRLHVRVDERSAGFLALGLSIGSGLPVAVVTTSGTAVGNLVPAVMEACHSGRRLVVVSADRPAPLRGTGANQTTFQAGLFGRFAPSADLAVDAEDEVVEGAVREACARVGPTHLNVQFDAPLVPAAEPWWPGRGSVTDPPVSVAPAEDRGRPLGGVRPVPRSSAVEVLPAGPRTVVVAGDGAGPAARELAEAGRYPLLAEPTSGARCGECAVRTYRLLLGTPLGEQVERVVVTGHPTLSRPVTELLSRRDVELVSVVGPGGVVTDPARRGRHLCAVPGAAPGDEQWLQAWRRADSVLSERVDDYVDTLPELHALQAAADVAAAADAGAALVAGSSNPIRDLDLVQRPSPSDRPGLVVANRGLSGIDGTVSSAVGVALSCGEPTALALLGDLTFLHDSTGLLLGRDEPRPDLTLVVVNDDGGSIFALLEQGAPEYAAAFERVFATPTGVDLAASCAASGTAYELATTRAQLRAALAAPSAGVRVVEARVGRADRRDTAAAIAALAKALG